jgi:hypothetical protein
MLQEAAHRLRRVPRQPGLRVAGAQQRLAFGAAGRGAMREQDAHAWLLGPQLFQQDRGRPGFAERDRMDPDPAAVAAAAVAAETLVDMLQVARLGGAALAQFAPQERLGAAHHERIQGPDHATLTRNQAAQTCSTDGVGAANTLRWRGGTAPLGASGPVRHAVSTL